MVGTHVLVVTQDCEFQSQQSNSDILAVYRNFLLQVDKDLYANEGFRDVLRLVSNQSIKFNICLNSYALCSRFMPNTPRNSKQKGNWAVVESRFLWSQCCSEICHFTLVLQSIPRTYILKFSNMTIKQHHAKSLIQACAHKRKNLFALFMNWKSLLIHFLKCWMAKILTNR